MDPSGLAAPLSPLAMPAVGPPGSTPTSASGSTDLLNLGPPVGLGHPVVPAAPAPPALGQAWSAKFASLQARFTAVEARSAAIEATTIALGATTAALEATTANLVATTANLEATTAAMHTVVEARLGEAFEARIDAALLRAVDTMISTRRGEFATIFLGEEPEAGPSRNRIRHRQRLSPYDRPPPRPEEDKGTKDTARGKRKQL